MPHLCVAPRRYAPCMEDHHQRAVNTPANTIDEKLADWKSSGRRSPDCKACPLSALTATYTRPKMQGSCDPLNPPAGQPGRFLFLEKGKWVERPGRFATRDIDARPVSASWGADRRGRGEAVSLALT